MKFSVKLAVFISCLTALLFGVGGSLLISISFRDSLEREKTAALASFRTTMETMLLVGEADRRQTSDSVVEALTHLSGGSPAWSAVRLTSDTGTLYSYGALSAQTAAAAGAGSCTVTVSAADGGGRIVVAGALTAGGAPLTLVTAYDVSAVYRSRAAQQRAFRWVFAVMATLTGAVSCLAARLMTRPITVLSRASRRIAAGDLACRARVRSDDELGGLAHDFNIMARRIEAGVGELRGAMERQERFMGSFAHEMKTPMTSVIGYADLIRSGALAEDETRDAANYIFSEGRRLESLSLKLLEILVTKEKGAALAPVRPAALISAVCEHTAPVYAARGITLRYRCAEGECLMDADLAGSLIHNLLDNAAKAIDGEGGIFVLGEMTADGCRISVTDTGRGMTEETMKHITEAFWRADKTRARAQGGAGLGLTLAAEIAAVHGGSLAFSSRMGQGTRVTAELKGGRA